MGLAGESPWLCPALPSPHPSSPSCPAHKPPTLLPPNLRGSEPCPGRVQEMEKPSGCRASVAAGKLLAGVEMLSPPAQQLCRAGCEWGARPAPPGPVAQHLKPGEGQEEPRGHAELTRAQAELRRQQHSRVTVIPPSGPEASMVPPCHSGGDLRDHSRCQCWRGLECVKQDRASSGSAFLAASPAEVRGSGGTDPCEIRAG